MHVPRHSDPFNKHARGFLDVRWVGVCPSPWLCRLLIKRHIFYKCCHKQCSIRIDGGTARKRRGSSGWGDNFFWRITEDLMVAIKKQMHWPWMQDLKDIFNRMLICASDQTQNSNGKCLKVAQCHFETSCLLTRCH